LPKKKIVQLAKFLDERHIYMSETKMEDILEKLKEWEIITPFEELSIMNEYYGKKTPLYSNSC
jgi:uncharacterized membrane protein